MFCNRADVVILDTWGIVIIGGGGLLCGVYHRLLRLSGQEWWEMRLCVFEPQRHGIGRPSRPRCLFAFGE